MNTSRIFPLPRACIPTPGGLSWHLKSHPVMHRHQMNSFKHASLSPCDTCWENSTQESRGGYLLYAPLALSSVAEGEGRLPFEQQSGVRKTTSGTCWPHTFSPTISGHCGLHPAHLSYVLSSLIFGHWFVLFSHSQVPCFVSPLISLVSFWTLFWKNSFVLPPFNFNCRGPEPQGFTLTATSSCLPTPMLLWFMSHTQLYL